MRKLIVLIGAFLLPSVLIIGVLPADAVPQTPEPAYIRVLLPPGGENASVMFGTHTTTEQKGLDRLFVTPPLAAGANHSYEISAALNVGGKELKQARTVSVKAGQTTTVDFTKPDEAKKEEPKQKEGKKDAKKQDGKKQDAKKDGQKKETGPVRTSKKTGHKSNYDEAKVKPFVLPEVLKLANGQPVTDAETWFKNRRPEILALYAAEIYGRVPANAPKVRWEVTSTDPKGPNGTTVKRIVGHMGDKANGPQMNVTLFLPAKAATPVPVILTITFGGGKGKGAKDGGAAKAPGDATPILNRGWAYATVGYNDIQPDRNNAFNEGVIGLTLAKGQTKPAADEWGSVSAWAWGISRIVDYFETDKDIDAKCVGIQGHSRLGRTVLWAGAQDDRIAATFASGSGCAGAALARYDWGETVDEMAENFAWQLGGNYQKWAGKWNDMPVDSHMLIACVAPRTLFCNGGLGDQWAAPKSQFLALVAAGPVFKLVGKKDLGVTDLPPLDKVVNDGNLGWNYHSEGHVATAADWRAFLDMADRQFKANKGGKS